MGLHSSRNSNLSRNNSIIPSCIPFLAFLSFSIFLLYKVDIYITQSRRVPRHREAHFLTPISYQPRVITNGTFDRCFVVSWGDDHAKILEDGELLTLTLDKKSGSGFESRKEYLFGKINMQLKLIPGNSAGTLSSEGDRHDEIDFEFLGNSSGEPYTLHTNVFSQGKGNREQQFFLWFDPTADFHTYSILWNPERIIFYVDGIPIREFKNAESIGVPFPKSQPMRIYSSLWNAEAWATQHGLVKTDWSRAPFSALYRNFSAEACIWWKRSSSCPKNTTREPWFREKLNTESRRKLQWVRKYHMVYDYCTDTNRFPEGLAPECKLS